MSQTVDLYKQNYESLVDRLNKLDMSRQGTMPKALERTKGRVALENPMTGFNAGNAIYNTDLKSQVYSAQTQMDALDKLMQLIQSEKDSERKDSELALKMKQSGYDESGEYTSDAQAMLEFIKQGGGELLKNSPAADKGAFAREGLKMGVNNILGQMPLTMLLTDKENEARTTATSLLNTAGSIMAGVSPDGTVKNTAGVGRMGGLLGGLLNRGQELRSMITTLTAEEIKKLSGVAVSDREVSRLKHKFPAVTDPEQQIYDKSKVIAGVLQIGLQMQEKAKKENLTLDQAYEKYGKAAYEAAGMEVPAWLKSGSSSKTTTGMVRMSDPSGVQYDIDASEVDEAVKNGWRKL